MRTADHDASSGALQQLQRIVACLRQQWPQVRLTIRADSCFCRDEIMTWCEANDVHYILGLARNSRLEAWLAPALFDSPIRYL